MNKIAVKLKERELRRLHGEHITVAWDDKDMKNAMQTGVMTMPYEAVARMTGRVGALATPLIKQCIRCTTEQEAEVTNRGNTNVDIVDGAVNIFEEARKINGVTIPDELRIGNTQQIIPQRVAPKTARRFSTVIGNK